MNINERKPWYKIVYPNNFHHFIRGCRSVNMSFKNLHKVADFLKLLLTTTKQQIRALFYTITPIQTAALCEILFNLRRLPLTGTVIKELKKRKFIYSKLVDATLSHQKKLALIQTHYRQIQNTLELVKSELLSMLE